MNLRKICSVFAQISAEDNKTLRSFSNLSLKSNETAQFKHELKRIKKFSKMRILSAAKR